jgi:hypothetical protein
MLRFNHPYGAVVEEWVSGDTADIWFYNPDGADMYKRVKIANVKAPDVSTKAGKVSLDWANQVCPPQKGVMIYIVGLNDSEEFLVDMRLPNGLDYGGRIVLHGLASYVGVQNG